MPYRNSHFALSAHLHYYYWQYQRQFGDKIGIILILKMRAHRAKFDTSKPFRIVTSRTAFDSLHPTDRLFPAADHHDHPASQQREEIVVPAIEVLPRLTNPKPQAQIPPNYIRIHADQCLPRPEDYELTEVDWLFLAGLRKRYPEIEELASEDFLARALMELEKRAGRDSVLPRSKGWIVEFLKLNYPKVAEREDFDQFAAILYNYWKSRREELRFPLWRPLWHPADNQFNHMLAFKAREKRARNLRRTNRQDETELIQDLHDEFQNAAMLCERIQLREELKVRSAHLQLLAFAQECKQFFDIQPLEELPQSDTKEKVRAARVSTQAFKRRRQSIDAQSIEPEREILNTRESLAKFLANVVYQAEKQGISHDSFFPNYEPPLPALKAALAHTNRMIQELPQEEEQVEPKEQTVLFSLRRHEDMLMRTTSEDEEEQEAAARDYLSSRLKRVTACYLGNDDQLGDTRDLRKTISSNFKRFLQSNNPPPSEK